MSIRRFCGGWPWLGPALVLALLPGCRGEVKPREQSPAEVSLQKLAGAWTEFASGQGRPPADVDDLKDWARRRSVEFRIALGIEDVETAFVSPRDQQPYVLVPPSDAAGGPDAIVACERSGVAGRRLVVNALGNVWEMSEADLRQKVPNLP